MLDTIGVTPEQLDEVRATLNEQLIEVEATLAG
jgi:hypothetical protein